MKKEDKKAIVILVVILLVLTVYIISNPEILSSEEREDLVGKVTDKEKDKDQPKWEETNKGAYLKKDQVEKIAAAPKGTLIKIKDPENGKTIIYKKLNDKEVAIVEQGGKKVETPKAIPLNRIKYSHGVQGDGIGAGGFMIVYPSSPEPAPSSAPTPLPEPIQKPEEAAPSEEEPPPPEDIPPPEGEPEPPVPATPASPAKLDAVQSKKKVENVQAKVSDAAIVIVTDPTGMTTKYIKTPDGRWKLDGDSSGSTIDNLEGAIGDGIAGGSYAKVELQTSDGQDLVSPLIADELTLVPPVAEPAKPPSATVVVPPKEPAQPSSPPKPVASASVSPKKAPEQLVAEHDKAIKLFEERKYDESIKVLQTLIGQGGDDNSYYYQIGLAQRADGKLDEAAATFQKLLNSGTLSDASRIRVQVQFVRVSEEIAAKEAETAAPASPADKSEVDKVAADAESADEKLAAEQATADEGKSIFKQWWEALTGKEDEPKQDLIEQAGKEAIAAKKESKGFLEGLVDFFSYEPSDDTTKEVPTKGTMTTATPEEETEAQKEWGLDSDGKSDDESVPEPAPEPEPAGQAPSEPVPPAAEPEPSPVPETVLPSPESVAPLPEPAPPSPELEAAPAVASKVEGPTGERREGEDEGKYGERTALEAVPASVPEPAPAPPAAELALTAPVEPVLEKPKSWLGKLFDKAKEVFKKEPAQPESVATPEEPSSPSASEPPAKEAATQPKPASPAAEPPPATAGTPSIAPDKIITTITGGDAGDYILNVNGKTYTRSGDDGKWHTYDHTTTKTSEVSEDEIIAITQKGCTAQGSCSLTDPIRQSKPVVAGGGGAAVPTAVEPPSATAVAPSPEVAPAPATQPPPKTPFNYGIGSNNAVTVNEVAYNCAENPAVCNAVGLWRSRDSAKPSSDPYKVDAVEADARQKEFEAAIWKDGDDAIEGETTGEQAPTPPKPATQPSPVVAAPATKSSATTTSKPPGTKIQYKYEISKDSVKIDGQSYNCAENPSVCAVVQFWVGKDKQKGNVKEAFDDLDNAQADLEARQAELEAAMEKDMYEATKITADEATVSSKTTVPKSEQVPPETILPIEPKLAPNINNALKDMNEAEQHLSVITVDGLTYIKGDDGKWTANVPQGGTHTLDDKEIATKCMNNKCDIDLVFDSGIDGNGQTRTYSHDPEKAAEKQEQAAKSQSATDILGPIEADVKYDSSSDALIYVDDSGKTSYKVDSGNRVQICQGYEGKSCAECYQCKVVPKIGGGFEITTPDGIKQDIGQKMPGDIISEIDDKAEQKAKEEEAKKADDTTTPAEPSTPEKTKEPPSKDFDDHLDSLDTAAIEGSTAVINAGDDGKGGTTFIKQKDGTWKDSEGNILSDNQMKGKCYGNRCSLNIKNEDGTTTTENKKPLLKMPDSVGADGSVTYTGGKVKENDKDVDVKYVVAPGTNDVQICKGEKCEKCEKCTVKDDKLLDQDGKEIGSSPEALREKAEDYCVKNLEEKKCGYVAQGLSNAVNIATAPFRAEVERIVGSYVNTLLDMAWIGSNRNFLMAMCGAKYYEKEGEAIGAFGGAIDSWKSPVGYGVQDPVDAIFDGLLTGHNNMIKMAGTKEEITQDMYRYTARVMLIGNMDYKIYFHSTCTDQTSVFEGGFVKQGTIQSQAGGDYNIQDYQDYYSGSMTTFDCKLGPCRFDEICVVKMVERKTEGQEIKEYTASNEKDHRECFKLAKGKFRTKFKDGKPDEAGSLEC